MPHAQFLEVAGLDLISPNSQRRPQCAPRHPVAAIASQIAGFRCNKAEPNPILTPSLTRTLLIRPKNKKGSQSRPSKKLHPSKPPLVPHHLNRTTEIIRPQHARHLLPRIRMLIRPRQIQHLRVPRKHRILRVVIHIKPNRHSRRSTESQHHRRKIQDPIADMKNKNRVRPIQSTHAKFKSLARHDMNGESHPRRKHPRPARRNRDPVVLRQSQSPVAFDHLDVRRRVRANKKTSRFGPFANSITCGSISQNRIVSCGLPIHRQHSRPKPQNPDASPAPFRSRIVRQQHAHSRVLRVIKHPFAASRRIDILPAVLHAAVSKVANPILLEYLLDPKKIT